MKKLPILDVALYHSNRSAFVEEIRQTCHSVGFFLLKHDFPQNLDQRMLQESRNFFQRPLEEKRQISYLNSPSFRGYMEFGKENTAGKLDHREQIEYAVEYPNMTVPDTGHFDPDKPFFERLKSPTNPWPTAFQPSLQPTTLDFAQNVCRVADCIRDSLCLALGLDPKILKPSFEKGDSDPPHWVIKLISYPETDPKNIEAQQGVGPHTDTNFLTFVLQDNVGGLQAFCQGEWIDVPTDIPQVLVCNLGEQAELWSRGYFLATPHRVLSKPQSRISVPIFYNPALSATVEPIDELHAKKLSWDRPKEQKHWRRENNQFLLTVGDNTFKSLARSHPEVFNRHHPDLAILEDGRIVPRKNI